MTICKPSYSIKYNASKGEKKNETKKKNKKRNQSPLLALSFFLRTPELFPLPLATLLFTFDRLVKKMNRATLLSTRLSLINKQWVKRSSKKS